MTQRDFFNLKNTQTLALVFAVMEGREFCFYNF